MNPMQELLSILRRLRAPDGCPWDREQTHASLRRYLLEEAAEAADAISAGDLGELRAELGDVLLQVAFHSVIAEEEGHFSYHEVERGIVDKLIRRHPHVFGDVQVGSSAEVVSNWQSIKAQEHAQKHGAPRPLSKQIPAAAGALAREQQAQKLLPREQQAQKLLEKKQAPVALPTDPTEADIGAYLAAAVALAAAHGYDAETALRAHTNRTLQQAEAGA